MTCCHPRRRLNPGGCCSEESPRVAVHLNIHARVCRPLPADVVVRSDRDTSVSLLKAAGDSVIAAAVSGLVVAQRLAFGPATVSQITVQVAIRIRAAGLQAILIGCTVSRVRVVAWMIMSPVADEPAVRDSRLQRLLQTKRHKRLGRNIHVFAPGQDLSTGSRCRAKASPNRRTFSAAGNGADDRTDHCPAAEEFTSAAIGPETVRLLRVDDSVLRLNAISLPVDRNGLQIQSDLVLRNLLYQQFNVCPSGNRNIAIPVDHILVHYARKHSAIAGTGIDLLIGSNGNRCSSINRTAGLGARTSGKERHTQNRSSQ